MPAASAIQFHHREANFYFHRKAINRIETGNKACLSTGVELKLKIAAAGVEEGRVYGGCGDCASGRGLQLHLGDEIGGLDSAILRVGIGGRLLLARPADACEDCGTNDEAGRSQGSGHRGLGLGCGVGREEGLNRCAVQPAR